MHKQAYVPITMSIKTIQNMTNEKFESKVELIDLYLGQASGINKKNFHRQSPGLHCNNYEHKDNSEDDQRKI